MLPNFPPPHARRDLPGIGGGSAGGSHLQAPEEGEQNREGASGSGGTHPEDAADHTQGILLPGSCQSFRICTGRICPSGSGAHETTNASNHGRNSDLGTKNLGATIYTMRQFNTTVWWEGK